MSLMGQRSSCLVNVFIAEVHTLVGMPHLVSAITEECVMKCIRSSVYVTLSLTGIIFFQSFSFTLSLQSQGRYIPPPRPQERSLSECQSHLFLDGKHFRSLHSCKDVAGIAVETIQRVRGILTFSRENGYEAANSLFHIQGHFTWIG